MRGFMISVTLLNAVLPVASRRSYERPSTVAEFSTLNTSTSTFRRTRLMPNYLPTRASSDVTFGRRYWPFSSMIDTVLFFTSGSVVA